jgi:hypothetical protein
MPLAISMMTVRPTEKKICAAGDDLLPDMKVFHVVPRVKETDGVAQYALALATAMNVGGATADHAVIAALGSGERQDDTACRQVHRAMTDEVLNALAQARDHETAVVVHVSHYGYAKRGNPTWLPRRVDQWKKSYSKLRIITMFHEVFAFGPPWCSAFWLSPVQRSISRRLLSLSDHAVTNTPSGEAILRGWARTVPISLLPVFSNVGEPDTVRPAADREATAVVFGRAGVETLLYQKRQQQLADAVLTLGVERLIDIGPRTQSPPARIGPAPVEVRGVLPVSEISEILSASLCGFIAYPPVLLGKSGVFAAYAAHGVIPVMFWPSRRCWHDERSLYLDSCDLRSLDEAESLTALQGRLCDWYGEHTLQKQAERWCDIIANKYQHA